MFSAIEYPHWLMLAGAFLVLSGLIGLAYAKPGKRPRTKRWKRSPEPYPSGRRTGG